MSTLVCDAPIPPRFLSSKHSDLVVADLVRFVCVVFHPNNKLLQSPVVPRWALLGWILTCWYVCPPCDCCLVPRSWGVALPRVGLCISTVCGAPHFDRLLE